MPFFQRTMSLKGLVTKSSVGNVKHSIDVQVTPSSCPKAQELDEELGCHRIGHDDQEKAHGQEPIYIDFENGDKRDPVNFSWTTKWMITMTACTLTGMSAATASSYSMGVSTLIQNLNCTEFQATQGLSLYALGFGVFPLVTSSFSEEFGRQPIYIGSTILFMLSCMTVALAPNVQAVIVARFFSGGFSSTGAAMVGGTIADIWRPHQRGLPMSIFAVSAIGGTGLGAVAGGWIEMNPHLGWRWIQWLNVIVGGCILISIITIMQETRSVILLLGLAKKIRKKTGDDRYRARVEDEPGRLRKLIIISLTRPILLLFTEPIVLSFSLWIGLAWGIVFVMVESIGPIFKNLHNFNTGETGTVFVAMFIGTMLGFFSNFYQESLYQKHYPTRGPEARLYLACFAAFLFPIGMFIYAWSSFPFVHWMGLVSGITIFTWATLIIYLVVFTYLADCYGPFASSALAGQSLCRNIMAMAFPLFTNQMFATMTYKWASTLFAILAVIMIPIPYILFAYGPQIRARSRFSSQVLHNST